MTKLYVHPAHKDWLKAILDPVKEVVIKEVQRFPGYDTNGNIVTFTETDVTRLNLLKDPRGYYFHDGYYIFVNNQAYYANTFNEIGFRCNSCSNYFLNDMHYEIREDNHICKDCAYKIQRIGAKSTRDWSKLKMGNGTDATFGIELEFCVPIGKDPFVIADAAYRHVIDTYNYRIPTFITTDSSLTNGAEFNFWPMTLEYYKEHADKFIAFIEHLKSNGASHGTKTELGNFKEQAGIHIHISVGAVNTANMDILKKYEAINRPFFMEWSSRSIDRYEHWCTGSYSFFGIRNSQETCEYRAYSSKEVLNDPKILTRYIEWVDTLAKASNEPALFLYPPKLLASYFGYTHLYDNVKDINFAYNKDSIDAMLACIKECHSKKSKTLLALKVKEYLETMNKCNYWYITYNNYIIYLYNVNFSNMNRPIHIKGLHITTMKADIVDINLLEDDWKYAHIDGTPIVVDGVSDPGRYVYDTSFVASIPSLGDPYKYVDNVTVVTNIVPDSSSVTITGSGINYRLEPVIPSIVSSNNFIVNRVNELVSTVHEPF